MSATKYTAPYVDHPGFEFLGSFHTVCKGTNRSDDVKLTEKSALVLRAQPDNKFDSNAIRVLTRDPTSGKELSTGYIPKKLAAEMVGALNDTKSVSVDCLMIGRGDGSRLMGKHIDTWYEVQLDWFVKKDADSTMVSKLKEQMQNWKEHEASYVE